MISIPIPPPPHEREGVSYRILLIFITFNFDFLVLYKMYFQNYFANLSIKLESSQAIQNFETETSSKFVVYYREKSFGANGFKRFTVQNFLKSTTQ